MGADELCLQSISALATRIKRRELSPVEVTQAYEAHTDWHTRRPPLNV